MSEEIKIGVNFQQTQPPRPVSIEEFKGGKFSRVLFTVVDATEEECAVVVALLKMRAGIDRLENSE